MLRLSSVWSYHRNDDFDIDDDFVDEQLAKKHVSRVATFLSWLLNLGNIFSSDQVWSLEDWSRVDIWRL